MPDTKHSVYRGRPRKLDPAEGISIAAKLFRERGYDAVGVAELTAAMAIKPPSFYAAFGSKRKLLQATLDHYSRQEGNFAEPILKKPLAPRQLMAQLFAAAAGAYSTEGRPLGCLIMECTRNCTDREAQREAALFKNEFRQAIRKKLADHRPEMAETWANYAMTVLAGLSASAREGIAREELFKAARLAAEGID